MRIALVFAVALVAGIWSMAALAQAPVPAPKATPEQIAAARGEADRLIAAAHAQAYFVNVTKDGAPTVRHNASGMECQFEAGQAMNEIHVYQSNAAPGEDVSCNTRNLFKDGGYVITTLYASRYPDNPEPDGVLGSLVASMRKRLPDMAPATGKFFSARTGPDAPPHHAARFQGTVNGTLMFTRAATASVRGWILEQRVSSPADHAQPADLLAEIEFISAMAQVQHATVDQIAATASVLAGQDAAEDEAHRLLRSSPVGGQFSDATTGGTTRLVHTASGAICQFGRDPAQNRLTPTPSGFVCGSVRDAFALNFEVSFAPGMEAAQAADLVAKFIAKDYPGAELQAGFPPPLTVSSDGQAAPLHATRQLLWTGPDGRKVFVRLAYAVVGDWLVFQRVFASPFNARIDDELAEAELARILAAMAQHQRDLPPGPAQPKMIQRP